MMLVVVGLLLGSTVIVATWIPVGDLMATFRARLSSFDTAARPEAWWNALLVARAHPLFGVADYSHAVTALGRRMIAHPQNGLLGIATMFGLPATVAYVALLIHVIPRKALRTSSSTASGVDARLIIENLMIAYVVFMITETVPWSVQVQLPFFLLVSTTLAYHRRYNPRARKGMPS